ncbi:MAG: hypothetical protein IPM29_11475 [Planctomycetes bacterium]|nr:hypothetical protein [Planctomycetota bacterium]
MTTVRSPSPSAVLLAALALVTTAAADEVRLADGRVLYGAAQQRGDVVVVETTDGTVRVAADQVVRIRDDAELGAELDGLEQRYGSSPLAHLELARLAWRYRLSDRMWRYLELADATLPATGSLRDRLTDTLGELDDELLPTFQRRAPAERRITELLYRARPGVGSARIAAIEAVLARIDDPRTAELLAEQAREAPSSLRRRTALRALQARDGETAEPFVWLTAIVDPDAGVRTDVVQRTVEQGRAGAAASYLARGLEHDDGRVMMRTADVLGALRHPAALAPLVAAGPRAAAASLPGGSVRGHVAFLNQQSYVRDFDVEVAMSSFVADPQVDVLQSGVVLDVTVHAVTLYRTHLVTGLRRAIVAIAGDDPGADPATWSAWLAAREAAGGAAAAPVTGASVSGS